jgi:hypothetical protein
MFERGEMGRGIDAAREAGGDHEAFERKIGGDLAGEFLSDGGAVARAG